MMYEKGIITMCRIDHAIRNSKSKKCKSCKKSFHYCRNVNEGKDWMVWDRMQREMIKGGETEQ